MKRILLAFTLLYLGAAAFGAETGFSTKFGNFGISDYSDSSDSYIPYFQWAAEIFYRDKSGLNEDLEYGFTLSRDTIRGYNLKSELSFIQPWYSISFGPVFGIINESLTLIKPGFSGSIRGQMPGIFFAELGGDMIPAQYAGAADDYSSYSGYYSIGFYMMQNHILCYFTQELLNYASLSGSTPYTNSSLSYIFYADFFEKNSIFKIETKIGYEILNRTFSVSETDIEIKNILLGLRGDFFVGTGSSFFIGIDNKIYPVSSGSIVLADVPGYLVTVESGFTWRF